MKKSKPKKEYFSSRVGLILSMMGVAVGAGNIWRFSRVVAQNGGGSFIIPWVIFLFIWSIPLIIAEIGMGKITHSAPIGAMAKTAGKRYAWMGAFIALVTTGILFYYSVVVGWGFRYFFYSLLGNVTATSDHLSLWESFTHSLQPLLFHLLSLGVGCYVIFKGIAGGIEKTNKVLIPALLTMIVIIGIRAVTLPGAWEGILYFFTPTWSDLAHHKIWLEALTQNAWDTGAGWGLLLVYSGYIKKNESVTVNGSLTAFANNAVSLLMGITIFSAAFALSQGFGAQDLISGEGSSNVGLTFIYLPQIFQSLPGGPIVHSSFAAIFFLAFSFAALSSLISMLQLTSQIFTELGMPKRKAIFLTGFLSALLGAPSALSMAIFDNQDWVWSVGLIVNGLFIAMGVIRYGVERFRSEGVNSCTHDIKLGKWYNWVIGFLVPLQAIILIGWFFYQAIAIYGVKEAWNPLRVYSLGTIIVQWGIGVIAFLLLNRWLVAKTLEKK